MPAHAPKGPIKAKENGQLKTAIAVLDPMNGKHPLTAEAKEGQHMCSARSKQTGKPCGRRAIPGGNVCRWHGGAAPQVKIAAMQRLQDFQDRAISRLFALAEDGNYPSTSYQAVRDVLDRTLGKPAETVRNEHSGELVIKHEIDRE